MAFDPIKAIIEAHKAYGFACLSFPCGRVDDYIQAWVTLNNIRREAGVNSSVVGADAVRDLVYAVICYTDSNMLQALNGLPVKPCDAFGGSCTITTFEIRPGCWYCSSCGIVGSTSPSPALTAPTSYCCGAPVFELNGADVCDRCRCRCQRNH